MNSIARRKLFPELMRLFEAALLAFAWPGLNAAGNLWAAGPSAENLPVFFVPNQGQYEPGVHFAARTPGLTAYFRTEEVAWEARGASIRVRFVGASAAPEVAGLDRLPAQVHFLLGADSASWTTDLPAFATVVYRGLYPGIDARYRASGSRLKSEFVVSPGADPGLIRLAWLGAREVRLGEDGALILETAEGGLREEPPEIYQESGGRRVPVEGGYRLFADGTVGFRVEAYDRGRPLILDPVISYSTYFGGSRFDAATAIAVDSAGNAYVTGWTESYDLRTAGPVQAAAGGVDAFVAKLNPAGALVYCTYLGGRGDDRGFGIAVDASGSAYVAGWTSSSNFPTAGAPLRAGLSGGRDAFVVKLNAAGNALVYGTYLGGSGYDSAYGIAVDSAGNALVAGDTTSTNFPTSHALQPMNAGQQDAFVVKLNAAGTGLLFGTYLGGAGNDRAWAIAADPAGNAYVTGGTDSTNFPAVAAVQAGNAGGQDAFAAKLNAWGTALIYSTYLGGSGGTVGFGEEGLGIAVDPAGNAWVTGTAASANFPVANAAQGGMGGGGTDAFAAKLGPGGALLTSTYLGGSGLDSGRAVALDALGNAYIAGFTSSVDWPARNPLQPGNAGTYDGFLVKLAPGGSVLESTYLGGSGSDVVNGAAAGASGGVYLAGQTLSNNFPLKQALQTANGGNFGGFILRLTDPQPPSFVSVTPSSGAGASQTFAFAFSDPNGWEDFQWIQVIISNPIADYKSCHFFFDVRAKLLVLLNDEGTAYLGPLAPGSQGTLGNSQCQVSGPASSVVGNGTMLTLSLALSFTPAYAGTKYIFLEALDLSGLPVGWRVAGAWNVPGAVNHPPTFDSVTPSSGSGTSQLFRFVFSDPNGYQDFQWIQVIISNPIADYKSCHFFFDARARLLVLLNDEGTAYLGPLAPGSQGTLGNSQCRVSGPAFSVVGNGTTLTLDLALSFTPAYAGSKYIFIEALDQGGLPVGWRVGGSWRTEN